MEENLEEKKEKNKFFKDKKNITIIVLSIILLKTLGSSTETSSQNNVSVETTSNLTSTLSEKEEIIIENKQQIEDLQKQNSILIEEKQKVEIEKNQLQEEKQNLENEISQLEIEKQNLETQKNSLEQENKSLNNQVQQLQRSSSTGSTKPNTTTPNATQNTNSAIVYVTITGEKYHKSNCSYLRQSKIQINLSDAKAQGYTPCSRCY